jgi:hypothetical protein
MTSSRGGTGAEGDPEVLWRSMTFAWGGSSYEEADEAFGRKLVVEGNLVPLVNASVEWTKASGAQADFLQRADFQRLATMTAQLAAATLLWLPWHKEPLQRNRERGGRGLWEGEGEGRPPLPIEVVRDRLAVGSAVVTYAGGVAESQVGWGQVTGDKDGYVRYRISKEVKQMNPHLHALKPGVEPARLGIGLGGEEGGRRV